MRKYLAALACLTTLGALGCDGGGDSGTPMGDGGRVDSGAILVDVGPSMLCGNGIQEGSEVCDGAGCSADCSMLLTCGDNDVQAGEQCDDGNTTAWDGCAASCQLERIALVEMLRFATGSGGAGCPSGNQFAVAAGTSNGQGIEQLNAGLSDTGAPQFVLSVLDLDDGVPPGDDSSLRIGWHQAMRSGSAYSFGADSLSGGAPRALMTGMVSSNSLVATADSLSLTVPGVPLDFDTARLSGTLMGSGGELSGIGNGQLCGVLTLEALGKIVEDQLDRPMSPLCLPSGICDFVHPPCSSMVADNRVTMADLLVGGWSYTANQAIFPGAQPDVDLDGGSIASFTVARTGGVGQCQPVITGCTRNGQSLTRDQCLVGGMSRAGYSAVLNLSARTVEFGGLLN